MRSDANGVCCCNKVFSSFLFLSHFYTCTSISLIHSFTPLGAHNYFFFAAGSIICISGFCSKLSTELKLSLIARIHFIFGLMLHEYCCFSIEIGCHVKLSFAIYKIVSHHCDLFLFTCGKFEFHPKIILKIHIFRPFLPNCHCHNIHTMNK